MSSSALAAGLRHLCGKLAAQQHNDDSDEQLLHAFIRHRQDSAFAALVRRHGPMVMHVCRRVLGHEQDAEDVFQATFLVLARQAAWLRKKSSLASFLYGTAYRLALKAQQAAARRRKHESQASSQPPANSLEELSWREVRALLDEEVERLPEHYRSIFILCCLEELSRAEAARRLGLNENTLSSRLAKARKLLSQRLARRGVQLTAVLAASAVAAGPASALSPMLSAATIKAALAIASGEGLAGTVSASVAELVQRMTAAIMVSKAKMITVLLLSAILAAGAGAWTYRALAAPKRSEPQTEEPATASRPAQGQRAETPWKEKVDSITVTGRVLDPDDKPVKGARLYSPRAPKTEPKSEEDIEFPQRAKTDAEGRFRFELPRSDMRPEWNVPLIAVADGYGVDGVQLPKDKSSVEVTLRLVKDQPIEGRILSTEGKPLAGVRVRALEISATSRGRIDDFLTAWQQQWELSSGQLSRSMVLPPLEDNTLTDKEGRFRITGAGSERLVKLRVSGPGVSQEVLYVITRAGFNPAAVNNATLDRIPARLRMPGQPPLLYGPALTYVAAAGRNIEGTVREAGSGKPVAGIPIHCGFGHGDGAKAVSDKNGLYKLENVPKMKQYLLNAWPPSSSAWLPTGARRDDEEGLRTLQIDFTLTRGIVVSGRVIDRTTGKGVRGGVRFVPLPGNKFAGKPGYDSYNYDHTMRSVDADGRFEQTVIPGPGVLMFQAYTGQGPCPYKQAEFEAKDRERVKPTESGQDRFFTAFNNSPEFLSIENAVKYLDIAPDASTAKCDLFVERGVSKTVRIEDPEGKPLAGTMVAGMTAKWIVYPIKDATCTIFALDPKKPRLLLFFHEQRNLGGSLTVRGDEKGPRTVRLAPAGTVTGRLLEHDGQPIVGAFVDLNHPDRSALDLYLKLRQRHPPIRTDKEGRFRLDGIVPDVKFTLSIYQGRTYFVGEPRIGMRQVKPGETLDLGAIHVKPGQ